MRGPVPPDFPQTPGLLRRQPARILSGLDRRYELRVDSLDVLADERDRLVEHFRGAGLETGDLDLRRPDVLQVVLEIVGLAESQVQGQRFDAAASAQRVAVPFEDAGVLLIARFSVTVGGVRLPGSFFRPAWPFL